MSARGRTEWTCECRDCDFKFSDENVHDMNKKAEEHLDNNHNHEIEVRMANIYYWEW